MGLTIVIDGGTPDGDIKNVLSFDGAGAILANAQEVVDEIRDIWNDFIATEQNEDYSWATATVYAHDSAPGTPGLVITPTAGTLVGLDSSVIMPTQVAMLVALSSNLNAPWRGRSFIGGLTENSNSVRGIWVQSAVDNIQAAFEAFQDMTVNGSQPVNLAIKSRGTATVAANTLAVVSTVLTRSRVATQRRRRLGQGS